MMKTINDEDLSVWTRSDGYYVQISAARGDKRIVLDGQTALDLAEELRRAGEWALDKSAAAARALDDV